MSQEKDIWNICLREGPTCKRLTAEISSRVLARVPRDGSLRLGSRTGSPGTREGRSRKGVSHRKNKYRNMLAPAGLTSCRRTLCLCFTGGLLTGHLRRPLSRQTIGKEEGLFHWPASLPLRTSSLYLWLTEKPGVGGAVSQSHSETTLTYDNHGVQRSFLQGTEDLHSAAYEDMVVARSPSWGGRSNIQWDI